MKTKIVLDKNSDLKNFFKDEARLPSESKAMKLKSLKNRDMCFDPRRKKFDTCT